MKRQGLRSYHVSDTAQTPPLTPFPLTINIMSYEAERRYLGRQHPVCFAIHTVTGLIQLQHRKNTAVTALDVKDTETRTETRYLFLGLRFHLGFFLLQSFLIFWPQLLLQHAANNRHYKDTQKSLMGHFVVIYFTFCFVF